MSESATRTPSVTVRLLISDTSTDESAQMFSDDEIADFLALEGGSIKRAAASALDTIASNEALTSKVIVDRHLQTNGAATAKALRDHASTLRDQAAYDDDNADGFYFGVVDIEGPNFRPENTGYTVPWPLY